MILICLNPVRSSHSEEFLKSRQKPWKLPMRWSVLNKLSSYMSNTVETYYSMLSMLWICFKLWGMKTFLLWFEIMFFTLTRFLLCKCDFIQFLANHEKTFFVRTQFLPLWPILNIVASWKPSWTVFLTNQFTTFHILNKAPQNIVFLLKAVLVNPFPFNVLILNPLKTSEIVRFAHFSRRYKLGILGRNGLM